MTGPTFEPRPKARHGMASWRSSDGAGCNQLGGNTLQWTSPRTCCALGEPLQPEPYATCYFEVLLVDAGSTGVVTVGLVDKCHPMNRHPGWELRSFGFSTNNGEIYTNASRQEVSLPSMSAGDVIGLGLYGDDLFLTKNGKQIGDYWRGLGSAVGLIPAIASASDGAVCCVNTGGNSFRCDLERLLGGRSIKSKPVPSGGLTRHAIPSRTTAMQLVGTGRKWLKVFKDNLTVRAFGKPKPRDVMTVRGSTALSVAHEHCFEVLVITGGSGAGDWKETQKSGMRRRRGTETPMHVGGGSNGRSVSTPHQRPGTAASSSIPGRGRALGSMFRGSTNQMSPSRRGGGKALASVQGEQTSAMKGSTDPCCVTIGLVRAGSNPQCQPGGEDTSYGYSGRGSLYHRGTLVSLTLL